MCKHYRYKTKCSICGEDCYGPVPVDWCSAYVHKDPQYCSNVLARKAKALATAQASLLKDQKSFEEWRAKCGDTQA